MSTRREVIVVGGGQAGLAIGYFIAKRGLDFTILEAAHEPAATWRERWDSLKLFTSARYDSLPGLPFPGEPERYPTRDEVATSATTPPTSSFQSSWTAACGHFDATSALS